MQKTALIKQLTSTLNGISKIIKRLETIRKSLENEHPPKPKKNKIIQKTLNPMRPVRSAAAQGKSKRNSKLKTLSAKKKVAAKPKKATAKKTPASVKNTVLDNVMGIIAKSGSGADITTLKSKTKLESRQLSNALYKLSKKGMIKTVSRGIYTKK